jgi:hypothetical protein
MRGVTELREPIAARVIGHWPVLAAFGYALSFVALFGGTALAAYRADVADQTAALLCGAAAILFARLYVRIALRIAQSIDAPRPPKPDEAAKSDGIPLWAVLIYAALGLALAYAIPDPESGSILAAIEFFIAWLAGCCTLNYLWRRRIDPESPSALDVIISGSTSTLRRTARSCVDPDTCCALRFCLAASRCTRFKPGSRAQPWRNAVPHARYRAPSISWRRFVALPQSSSSSSTRPWPRLRNSCSSTRGNTSGPDRRHRTPRAGPRCCTR